MPPAKTKSSDTTPKKLNKGDELEARVAQLWFWEGHYTRSGIDLKRHYQPEPLLVTDLDLLAYDFSPRLRRTKTIGEVKSGKTTKILDRLIWLRGLRELVDASTAELVTGNQPSTRARQLGDTLGVSAQSEKDVIRREQASGIDALANLGAHGPAAVIERNVVHKHCGTDADLERAFWFLRSEVWFLDPTTASKRLIGLYQQLAERWTPAIDDADGRALRWLLAETISVFVLNVTTLATDAISLDRPQHLDRLSEQLSAGIVDATAMRQIAADVDKYIGGLLVAANAPDAVRVEAIGALDPAPPTWVDSFAELIQRIAADPATARDLPRRVDLLVFERLTRRRHVPSAAVAAMSLDDAATGRSIRAIAAFLRGQVANIGIVDRALTTPIEARPDDTTPPDQLPLA